MNRLGTYMLDLLRRDLEERAAEAEPGDYRDRLDRILGRIDAELAVRCVASAR